MNDREIREKRQILEKVKKQILRDIRVGQLARAHDCFTQYESHLDRDWYFSARGKRLKRRMESVEDALRRSAFAEARDLVGSFVTVLLPREGRRLRDWWTRKCEKFTLRVQMALDYDPSQGLVVRAGYTRQGRNEMIPESSIEKVQGGMEGRYGGRSWILQQSVPEAV